VRLLLATAALAVGLMLAGCGDEAEQAATGDAPPRAATYPGDIGTGRCASHWYTGNDGRATVTCGADAYRIAFDTSGQERLRTVIEPAASITVSARVRATPASRVLYPGIGCWTDEEHGWIASLGADSAYVVGPDGSSDSLVRDSSPAVHELSRWNRIVLTCDARGSSTLITLRVNGTVVARNLDAGDPVVFDRFGMHAASEARATMHVSEITATTR
jgi:hypothetical protein